MKKFILHITLVSFAYFALSLFVYLQFFFSDTNEQVERTVTLASTKYTFVIKKIRIGDSVAKQYYPPGVDPDSGIITLTSHAGVSMLGHYLLLRKITLVNKDNLSDNLQIEGYFRPTSIAYNLDAANATNSFIKSFYNKEWLFNPQLIDPASARFLDTAFLGVYPKRKLISRLYTAGAKRLLNVPGLLNPETAVNKNTKSLSDALAPLMQKYFPGYKTYYCAVSIAKEREELISAANVRLIWKPRGMFPVLPDSLFMKDKAHFKEGLASRYWKTGL